MQPSSPYIPPPVQTPPQSPDYGFIVNPSKPPKRSLLPSNTSLPLRLVVSLGGLLVLVIIFVFIKGLLASNSNIPSLVNVAQDQQEIIHIATSTSQQQVAGQQITTSVASQNSAITAQLVLTSAQSQLVTYLKNNGKKVSAKTLGLKVSTITDQQLATAATNSTYDQTFQQVMQDQLKSYQQDLQQAYSQTKGPKGRKLLSTDYNGARLLLLQLNSLAS